jgi:magnesium-transporting ATPase (P-type)
MLKLLALCHKSTLILVDAYIFLVILQIEAQDIHVGDIIWLRENDEVPCDLVLLGTSEPQGICLVEVYQSAFTFIMFVKFWNFWRGP